MLKQFETTFKEKLLDLKKYNIIFDYHLFVTKDDILEDLYIKNVSGIIVFHYNYNEENDFGLININLNYKMNNFHLKESNILMLNLINSAILYFCKILGENQCITVKVNEWYIRSSEFIKLEKELNNEGITIEKTIKGSYNEVSPEVSSPNCLIIGNAGDFTREEVMVSQNIFLSTIPKIDSSVVFHNFNYIYRTELSDGFEYKGINMDISIKNNKPYNGYILNYNLNDYGWEEGIACCPQTEEEFLNILEQQYQELKLEVALLGIN